MELGRLYLLDAAIRPGGRAVRKNRAGPGQSRPNSDLNDALRKVLVGKGDLTYQLFGECYLEAGRLDEAQAAFEKAERVQGQRRACWPTIGPASRRARARAGRGHAASSNLRSAGDLSHEGTEPYELLAKLLADLGQPDQLIGRLEKLRHASRRQHAADLLPGRNLSQSGQGRTGRAPLSPALRFPPPASRRSTPGKATSRCCMPPAAGTICCRVLGRRSGKPAIGNRWARPAKALLADQAAVDALLEVARSSAPPARGRDDSARWLAAGLLAIDRKQYDDADRLLRTGALAAPAAKTPETAAHLGHGADARTSNIARAAEVFRRGTDEQLPPRPGRLLFLSVRCAGHGRSNRRGPGGRPQGGRLAARLGPLRKPHRLDSVSCQALRRRPHGLRASHRQVRQAIRRRPNVREVLHDVRLALSNIEIYQNHPDRAEAWLEELWDEYPGRSRACSTTWAIPGPIRENISSRSLRMIRAGRRRRAEEHGVSRQPGLGPLSPGPVPRGDRRAAHGHRGRKARCQRSSTTWAMPCRPTARRDAASRAWRRAVAAFDADGETEKSRQIQAKIDAARPSSRRPRAGPGHARSIAGLKWRQSLPHQPARRLRRRASRQAALPPIRQMGPGRRLSSR